MNFIHLSDILETGVSHDPNIRKRVIINNGRIPKLTNFSQSVFKPGQFCPEHIHSDMWEVYLIQSGEGVITIEGKDLEVKQGDCVIVDPGENHSIQNRCKTHDLHLTYFGIEQ